MSKTKSKVIKGAKGGEAARTPVEAPNSLRSIAYARILDLVSEGPIRGLVNGAQSIYLDETPLMSTDGTFNFKNVQTDIRLGTQDQLHIPGFPSVESGIAQGVELRSDTPWTRAVTNRNLDAVRIIISTPALSKTNTTNGDITGHSVGYAIDVATDGGAYQQVMTGTLTGKTTTKYERSHRIDLPKSNTTGWVLRVRRLTPNSSTATIADQTYIESITEIIDAKLRYPMSALIGLHIDASQFQNIPRRSYDLYGREIRVPTNYNPTTRQYTGVWDGTFKIAWTDNPAWCFYDLVTHPRYGLGHLIKDNHLSKWDLYKIGRYCDDLVPDGFGGQEPRMVCNMYLQTQGDAYKVVNDMATVFRGMSYWSASEIHPIQDAPSDPVYTYTPANVVNGMFTYSGTAKKVRHTVALVSWNDNEDFGRVKVEYVDDPEGIARYGIQQTDLTAVGCTSQGQAHRAGRYALLTAQYETDTLAFEVGMGGTLVVPGQIVKIADPTRAGKRMGGRIVSATNTVLALDAPVEAVNGNTVSVMLPDGVLQTRSISNVSEDKKEITVSTGFPTVPMAGAVWVVESPTLNAQTYRVIGVQENTEQRTFTVSAVMHNASKFSAVDTGTKIEVPQINDTPSPVQKSPTGIVIAPMETAGQVITNLIVEVSWNPAEGAINYDVDVKIDSGEWTNIGTRVTGRTARMPFGQAGSYVARVRARNALNILSQPAYSATTNISDQVLTPGFVDDINEEIIAVETRVGDNIAQEVIDRIAGDNAQNNALIAGLQAEALARAAAIQAEADEIWGVVDGLAASLGDITNADDWVITKAYPKDDMVKNAGKLYRARIAVPANTPISNTTYWQLVGDYTSLVDAVSGTISRVNVHDSQITELDEGLEAVGTTVTGHGTRLTNVETGVETNANATTALTTRVTNAEGVNTSQGSAITGLTNTINDPTTGLASRASASALSALTTDVTNLGTTQTSQGTAITAINTSLGGNGTNLMWREYSWFADPLPTIAMSPAASSTISRFAVTGAYNGNLLRAITASTSNTAFVHFGTTTTDYNMPLLAGKYIVSFYAYSTTAGHLIQPRMVNQAGTIVNGTNISLTTTKTRYAQVFTLPAGTTTGALRLMTNMSAATGRTIYIDQVQIEKAILDGVNPSPWVSGNSDRQLGSFASASALSALTTRVTDAEGVLSSTGTALTQLENRVDDTEADISGQATAISGLTTRVTNAEGVNTDQGVAIAAQATRVDSLEAAVSAPDFASVLSWEFINAASTTPAYNGFTGARMSFASFVAPTSYGATALSATGFDPNLFTPTFSLLGRTANIVRALVRRRSGTSAWAGALYWATTSHGITATHNTTGNITPARSAGDGWYLVEWDMSNNSDWNTSTVTQLRFTFDLDQPSTVDLRSITIGIKNGTSASSASVTSVSEASVSRDNALGTRIDTVTATANGAQSTASTALSAANGAATAITQVKSEQTGSGNLLINSEFDAGITGMLTTVNQWTGVNGGVNWAGSQWKPQGANNYGINGAASTVGYLIVEWTDKVACVAGEKFILSAYLAAHAGARGYVEANFYDVNGAKLSSSQDATFSTAGGGGLIANWTRVRTIAVAPANAASVTFNWVSERLAATSASPYSWICMPMMERARTDQTSPSPWSPGAAGLSSVTQTLKTGLNAKWGVTLDVNGYISGIESINNGSRSEVNILADRFRIISPGGGQRTEFSDGNWRIYDSSGVMRVRLGVW